MNRRTTGRRFRGRSAHLWSGSIVVTVMVGVLAALPATVGSPPRASASPTHLTAPFTGRVYSSLSFGTYGCGHLKHPYPSFNRTTGIAALDQGAYASISPGCPNTSVSHANGSARVGMELSFHIAGGYHSVQVVWGVVATLRVDMFTPVGWGGTDDCTFLDQLTELWNSTWSGIARAGYSESPSLTHLGPCYGGNASFVYHGHGESIFYFNSTFAAGIYHVQTWLNLASGTYVNGLGHSYARLNVATGGNYAQLVGVTVR